MPNIICITADNIANDGISADNTTRAYLAAVTGSTHGETMNVPDYIVM